MISFRIPPNFHFRHNNNAAPWRCSMRDFKLPPQSRWEPLSSRLSRNVGMYHYSLRNDREVRSSQRFPASLLPISAFCVCVCVCVCVYIYIYIYNFIRTKIRAQDIANELFSDLFGAIFLPCQCVFLVLSNKNTKGLDLMKIKNCQLL